MERHDQVIRRLRSQIMFTLTLRYSLALLAAWGFIWGTVVLVLRAAVGMEREPLVWGLVGVVGAVALAVEMARRRLPSVASVRALVDRRSAAGGLLMAEQETQVGAWRDRMPAVARPSVRWRGGRAWGLLLAASAFVLVGFLVPQRYVSVAAARPLEIGDQAGQLAEQIETLDEEQIIEDQKAADLREKLEQVRQEAMADDPVKTWESLDHLAKSLSDDAEEAAEDTLARTRKLSEAQSLAEGLAEDQAKTDPAMGGQMTAEAMAQLSQTLGELAAKNKQFAEMLKSRNIDPGELGKPGGAGMAKLTPEQMAQLGKIAQMAKAGKISMAEGIKRLVEARLIDAQMLAKCENAGKGDGKGLAKFLAENAGEMSMEAMLTMWCNNPGRGGVTRGRADAPMTWKQASEEEGARFKAQVLPPASLEAFKDSAMVGVSLGAPEVVETVAPAGSAALRGAQAGGGSANTQTVLPRHRAAVERYFERE